MNRVNSRMEGTEGRISELEDGRLEITQSEQHREKRLGKKKVSGTCGTKIKYLIFISLESQ